MRAGRHEIHGYAIVSADDRIADASGAMPEALRNEADWAYFQAELDTCALVILGRLGHLANPNRAGRRRVVLSSSARGLERRADGHWWNPADLPPGPALEVLLPEGGKIGVPGGRPVFDLFLRHGYDAFHLSRLPGLVLPGGTPLFTGCGEGDTAEGLLAVSGLAEGESRVIDPGPPVTLTVWRRQPTAQSTAP